MKTVKNILHNVILYCFGWCGFVLAMPLIIFLTILNPVATCKGLSAFGQTYKDYMNSLAKKDDKQNI